MRILLVEDEARLADALAYILKKQGYLVDVTGNGDDGQDMAQTGIYDVIILDRMLPGAEGVEILRHIRGQGITTPVIFVTAKDAVQSRIEGLDAGADDYLVKPFSKDELLARVRALGRRSENLLHEKQLCAGGLCLDTAACEVTTGDTCTKLTLTETQLLELLLRNKNQVLSKEQILDRIWGFDKEVELKNVELYIFYLRKKIDFSGTALSLETVRGVGYSLKEVTDA